MPTIPEFYGGISDHALAQYNLCLHPHKRPGSMLKSKRNKRPSRYTMASDRFSRSGQGDVHVFPDYADGDSVLPYWYCAFFNSLAMQFAVRTLPSDSRVDQGIEDLDALKSVDNSSERRSKRNSAEALFEGLKELSKSVAMPLKIQNISAEETLSSKCTKIQ